MPFVIPAVAAAIAGGLASAGLITSIGGLISAISTITSVLTAIVPLAISVGISIVSKLIMGKPSQSPLGSLQDRTQTIKQAITERRTIFGEIRVGGPITYVKAEKIGNEHFLTLLVTLAEHEIEAITEVYFAEELLEFDASGNEIGKYKGHVTIKKGLGSTATDADLLSSLQTWSGGEWTAAHKQEGCAKIALYAKYNRDLFPNGLPNLSVILKGAKIYDDRTGLTAYSNNPSLCLQHYIKTKRIGLGDTVNQSVANTAANDCEETVAIKDRLTEFTVNHVTTPTAAPTGSGVWAPNRWVTTNQWPNALGTFKWAVTFLDGIGETLPGPELVLNVSGSSTVGLMIRDIPTGPPGTVERKLYRTAVDASQLKLVTTLADNITTEYHDGVLDANLGVNAPISETTAFGEAILADSIIARSVKTAFKTQLTTTGTLPSPLVVLTDYWTVRTDNGHVEFATTEANAIAGVTIAVTNSGTGTHTMTVDEEQRYTCNGLIDSNVEPRMAMAGLLSSMHGDANYQGGGWNIAAGVWRAPTREIDEDEFAGPMDASFTRSGKDLSNGIKGVFSSPENFYQPSDFPAVKNATYLADDQGEEEWMDIDLPFTTSSAMAQRLAKIRLEEIRQQITVRLQLKLSAFDIQAGDNINLTYARYGWSSKAFKVKEWKFVVRDGGDAPAMGIDIVAEETASGIYDWALGEETTVDLAPNSTLPDPFQPDPPGIPVIVEELYETTGSAGVKARAHVSWAASADATVRVYDLEYKRIDEDETLWHVVSSLHTLSHTIDDIEQSYYDFRVKGYNELGVGTVYTAVKRQQLLGLGAIPADVTGFTLLPVNGFAVAQWTLHPDLDVRIGGDIVVKHTSKTSSVAWEDGKVVACVGGAEIMAGFIPLKSGTYMIKARDSGKRWSDGFASFPATEGLLTGFTTVNTSTQAVGFTGAKTNVTLASDKISITNTSTSLIGTYEFDTYEDMTTVKTRRFELDVNQLAFNQNNLLDDLGLIDTWPNIDGSKVDGCNVIGYIAITDDDPSGSPTWSAWMPFDVAEFTCRAAKFKVELISDAEENNIEISLLTVHVKEPV